MQRPVGGRGWCEGGPPPVTVPVWPGSCCLPLLLRAGKTVVWRGSAMALREREGDLEPAFTGRETEAQKEINFLDVAERTQTPHETSAFCFSGLLCCPHLSCPVAWLGYVSLSLCGGGQAQRRSVCPPSPPPHTHTSPWACVSRAACISMAAK